MADPCPACGHDALKCVSAYDNPAFRCGHCGAMVDEDGFTAPTLNMALVRTPAGAP